MIMDKTLDSQNTKLLPIIEVPASGKKQWYGGAFTIAFVKSKKGNFILRGYIKEIEEYLKKNYTHYFANLTLYHNGEHRNIWKFWKEDVSIYTNKIHRGRKTFRRGMQVIFTKEGKRTVLNFKRMPNKWIPEFDNL